MTASFFAFLCLCAGAFGIRYIELEQDADHNTVDTITQPKDSAETMMQSMDNTELKTKPMEQVGSSIYASASSWAHYVHARALQRAHVVNHSASSGVVPRVWHIVAEDCEVPYIARRLSQNAEVAKSFGMDVKCHGAQERNKWVKTNFPEYAKLYRKLQPNVLRADVFRYLLIAKEGGFYGDDDVVLLPTFGKNLANYQTVSQPIVGWERRTSDEPIGSWCADFGGMLCNSLAMFTFGARAHDPLLQDLADFILNDLTAHFTVDEASNATRGWGFRQRLQRQQYVLQHTGPVAFSTRLLMHMEPSNVLGIEAFGCGQKHSGSPPCGASDSIPTMWTQHLFEGKWRRDA